MISYLLPLFLFNFHNRDEEKLLEKALQNLVEKQKIMSKQNNSMKLGLNGYINILYSIYINSIRILLGYYYVILYVNNIKMLLDCLT